VGEVPKLQLAAYAAAAALAVVAAVRLFGGDGSQGGTPVSVDAGPRALGPAGGAAGRGRGRGELYVHVAGAVRRPGLYRVAAGARVAAAIERAGGLRRRADLTAVNLAAPIEDGQQVIVPRRGEQGAIATAGGSGSASPAAAGGARISLATATPEQLDTLDGIGPTLAGRIVDYRKEHGGFRSIEELRQVEGIGEKRFAALREALQP
jgi:competence protein ComEA